jgi:hypothetical protein
MPPEAAHPTFADLQRELPVSTPRAWRFAAQRAASRAGALVSDGLRAGYRHGFESGPFMDHVYADTPSGRTAIGREIDRRLLRRRTCLYGISHDDARIERHFADLAELVAPGQIVFNVQTRNPEIEYIARVWVNAQGERCVWGLRPVEQILGYAAAAGYTPAQISADRFGIYRVVRLVRAETA